MGGTGHSLGGALIIKAMENKKVCDRLDLQAHAFNPEVGLRDILRPGERKQDYNNLYVHLARGDPISEGYTYQDNPMGHVTVQDFEASHGGEAHSISNFMDENKGDSFDREMVAYSEQMADPNI